MPSSIAETVLQQFLQQLSTEDVVWRGGTVTLNYEHSGDLLIETNDRGILVLKVIEAEDYEISDMSEIALRMVSYDQSFPVHVKTGLYKDNQLILMCTLTLKSLTVASINEAVLLLNHLYQKIKTGATL